MFTIIDKSQQNVLLYDYGTKEIFVNGDLLINPPTLEQAAIKGVLAEFIRARIAPIEFEDDGIARFVDNVNYDFGIRHLSSRMLAIMLFIVFLIKFF